LSEKTALFDLHEQLGATLVDFHGWLLPLRYQGILAEHKRCRESACVFDTCHMGQFSVSGPGAADALDRVLTQCASALKPGRCKYGLLLNEEAGILDDTILMRLDEEDFMLVVNAGTRQKDFQWLQAHLDQGGAAVVATHTGFDTEARGRVEIQL
jgi:aminomethyltransferase